ncbi:MAG TPA: transglycosylase SLT domain-containing protein [Pseudolysinimonas sp.]|nr:transglycosylase SLT domain-containing protein [Pseudolysinimonas sp.]
MIRDGRQEAQFTRASTVVPPRPVRARWPLPIFSYLVIMAFVFVLVMSPNTPDVALADPDNVRPLTGQSLAVDTDGVLDATTRGVYGVVAPKPPPAKAGAPASGIPDPGTAKAIAYDMVMARGWGQGEYDCLVALWERESHWNVYASNGGSGAYGIPQALPGSKMATAGADWATNPATQITWGLGYISGRYGTPCGAWGHSQSSGWY